VALLAIAAGAFGVIACDRALADVSHFTGVTFSTAFFEGLGVGFMGALTASFFGGLAGGLAAAVGATALVLESGDSSLGLSVASISAPRFKRCLSSALRASATSGIRGSAAIERSSCLLVMSLLAFALESWVRSASFCSALRSI